MCSNYRKWPKTLPIMRCPATVHDHVTVRLDSGHDKMERIAHWRIVILRTGIFGYIGHSVWISLIFLNLWKLNLTVNSGYVWSCMWIAMLKQLIIQAIIFSHPFLCRIILSTPFAVISYFLIWYVPPVDQGKVLWYLVFYCLFQSLQTVWIIQCYSSARKLPVVQLCVS